MFDAVLGMPPSLILCGIIWAIVLGFAAGNYACSLVHRLPRGRLILDKTPYCGNCGTPLQVKDLFPVISALLLRHRCRYCGVSYPVSHTWTEILVGALFMLTFFKYNFTEQFLLVVLIGIFLIVLAAIHANEKMVMGKILLCTAIFGMMFRILQDHTIYNFFEGGLYCVLIGAVLWRKSIAKVGHIYTLPVQAYVLTVGGICAGGSQLPQMLALYAMFFALGKILGALRGKPIPYTIAFGLAVTVTVLYPFTM